MGTCRDSDGGDGDGTARKISNDGEHQQEEHDHHPLARQASAWAQTGRVLMVAARTWSASSEEGDEFAAPARRNGGNGGAKRAMSDRGEEDAARASSDSGVGSAASASSDDGDEGGAASANSDSGDKDAASVSSDGGEEGAERAKSD